VAPSCRPRFSLAMALPQAFRYPPYSHSKWYFVDRGSGRERPAAAHALHALVPPVLAAPTGILPPPAAGESALYFRPRGHRQGRDVDPTRSVPSVGVVAHSGPVHSKFSTVESRIRSFREWPPALRQQPKDLAEAGFFYIGQ